MEKEPKAKKIFKGENGQRILILGGHGDWIQASVRIKNVRCGKETCSKCPHPRYAYAKYREGKRTIEKYLGVVR